MHKYFITSFLFYFIIISAKAQTSSRRFYHLDADVKAAFANKSEGEIKIEEAKNCHSLVLIGESSVKYKIQSYKMILFCRGMDPLEYYCRGEGSCIDIPSFSITGCKFYFDNIVVSNENDQYFYLDSFSLAIIK